MREFFRGWKRKTGLLTLLLACVFTAGWVRSLMVTDSVNWHLGYEFVFFSHDGHVSAYIRTMNHTFRWTRPHFSTEIYRPFTDPGDKQNWKWNFVGVRFGSKDANEPYFHMVAIPNSYLVFPLTMLSAWLLLSKSRTPAKAPT